MMSLKDKLIIQLKNKYPLILLTLVVCIVACENGETVPVNEIFSQNNNMGVVAIPQDWGENSIRDAYDLARYCGTYISISEELGWTNNDHINSYQDDISYAIERNLNVIISMDVLTDSRSGIKNLPIGWESKDFSDETLRNAFIKEAFAIASTYQPEYFFLALEINAYAAENYAGFLNYTSMYMEAYDSIKVKYPNIKVGVTFQYEQMLAESQWVILGDFNDKLDCYGFTTYPQELYPDLNNIPENYYASVLNNLGRIPVIMTEIGWQGHQDNSNESQQQEFINKYFQLIEACNITVNIWCLLHDWPGGGFFQSMGLIDIHGRKKPAWDKWYKYSHQ